MTRSNPTISREFPFHGHMFPNLDEIRVTHATGGKVFTILVESCGTGFQKRERCPERSRFESSQRLGNSVLLPRETIDRHFHN